MILDDLANASIYFGTDARLKTAFEWLQAADLGALEPGRYEIDGDRIVASITDYQTRHEAELQWEAHRRHVDVQCVLSGAERIGVVPLRQLAAEPYDEARDVLFAQGAGEFVTLAPGRFVVLYPHDAHMPGVAAGAPAPVRKLVIKLRLAPATSVRSTPPAAP